jgi:chromosome segregation ATPase
MQLLWMIIVLLVYAATGAFVFFRVSGKRKEIIQAQELNLKIARDELEAKQEHLKELLDISLGLVRNEDVLALDAMLDDLQASINAEKGRVTITETEVDAIEIRLRELGELKRELEVSNMDALREVEMLKSQERDLANQNEALLEKLTEANDQVDILFNMFPDEGIQSNFNKVKEEISEIQTKLGFYQSEVGNINQQYVVLKKAYDALDIEYAQLYEKRQQDSGTQSDSDDE